MTNEVVKGEEAAKRAGEDGGAKGREDKEQGAKLSSQITFLRTPNFYPRHLYHSSRVFKDDSTLCVCNQNCN